MPKLVCLNGKNSGKEYILNVGEYTVGRSTKSDICHNDTSTSRTHCKIIIEESGDAHLEDLNSTNCSYVNETPVISTASLEHGDKITIGKAVYQYTRCETQGKTLEADPNKAAPSIQNYTKTFLDIDRNMFK